MCYVCVRERASVCTRVYQQVNRGMCGREESNFSNACHEPPTPTVNPTPTRVTNHQPQEIDRLRREHPDSCVPRAGGGREASAAGGRGSGGIDEAEMRAVVDMKRDAMEEQVLPPARPCLSVSVCACFFSVSCSSVSVYVHPSLCPLGDLSRHFLMALAPSHRPL